LGQGSARAFSPDAKWVLVLRQNISPPDFVLLPTGVGQQRVLSTLNIAPTRGLFLPDSKHIVFDGHESGRASRIYVMSLDGGQPRPITPEGFSMRGVRSLSPDGKRLVATTGQGLSLVSIDGGEPQPIRGTQPGDIPLGWSKDERSLLIGHRGETACPVSHLDLQTGANTPWKTFSPSNIAGLVAANCPGFSEDQEHYVFGYTWILSDLFLVENLK
jgi:hypothetical protein